MKKGTRIKTVIGSEEKHGVVTKGTRKQHGRIHIKTDDGKHYSVTANWLRLSDKPLPKALEPKKFNKGDHVTFEGGKKGIVRKGGSNIIAVSTCEDGEYFEVKGHVSLFEKAEDPGEFKDTPSAMDGYFMTKYTPYHDMSEETEAFHGIIKTSTGARIEARNDGHGGCNCYYGERADLDQLQADAKSWLEQNKSPYDFDPIDQWVTWYQYRRPHHVSAADDFAAEQKRYDAIAS